MKFTRQQVLLGLLILVGVVRVGDYILSSMIQGPLRELRAETNALNKEIEENQALLAKTRDAGERITAWTQRALPSDTETARSLYRNWVLKVVRGARLRNATVDSGSPSSRRGLFRALPFSVRARGTLPELTQTLFAIESADQLHQLTSLRLTPVGTTGQYEISIGLEALMLPASEQTAVKASGEGILAMARVSDYSVVAEDNIFGIGIDQQDPMKLTSLSAVTFSNGRPQAWLTEQDRNRVHRVGPGDKFDTIALSGQVIEITDRSVVLESGSRQYTLSIGDTLAQAKIADLPIDQ